MCTGVCWRIEEKIWNCEKIQKFTKAKDTKDTKVPEWRKSATVAGNSDEKLVWQDTPITVNTRLEIRLK